MVADEKNIPDRVLEFPLENEFDFLMEEAEKPYSIGHRCFYFSKEIIFFIKETRYEKIYHSIFDQLLRSASSIGANVIEGKAGSTKKDWKNYYVNALKSANEINIGFV